jgi:hypothetical protein
LCLQKKKPSVKGESEDELGFCVVDSHAGFASPLTKGSAQIYSAARFIFTSVLRVRLSAGTVALYPLSLFCARVFRQFHQSGQNGFNEMAAVAQLNAVLLRNLPGQLRASEHRRFPDAPDFDFTL